MQESKAAWYNDFEANTQSEFAELALSKCHSRVSGSMSSEAVRDVLEDNSISSREQLDDEGLARALIGAIWGPVPKSWVTISEMLDFYYSQICILRGEELAVKTHRDIVDVVNYVLDKKYASIKAIEDDLRTSPPLWLGPSDKAPTAAVGLALQLAFMIKPKALVGKNEAIEQLVPALFPRKTEIKAHGSLDFHFNALSLNQVGFTILKTSSLSDHLSLDQQSRTIRLFAHTDFLRSYQKIGSMSIYPPKFITETIKTAELFNGDDDSPLRKWSRRGWRETTVDLEMGSSEPASRTFADYDYWRERLFTLHEAYQHAKPRSLKQFWQDKRDSPTWWTFWLAVLVILLTLVFGLIQSITGIMQVTST